MIKTKQKLLPLLLILIVVAGILSVWTITARAATLPCGMTSSSIGVGSGSTLASSTTQIGFGGQRWYVVGFNGTGIDKGSEYVTLLAKGSMGSSEFSETGSTSYLGSNLQTFINALPSSYDSREQALMVGLTLDEVSGTQPTNQKIWALGTTEASTISSSVLDLADGAWVLRTMSQYSTARTVSAGVVNNFGPPNTTVNCVRPGTSLDLSKVLYASPISGAKDTPVGTMNSVALSSEVKFTILDSNLGLTIASAPASLTKAQGSTISLSYSNAQTGDGKYVSCVLVSNSDSMVKYYSKLSASASGTLSIPISSDIIAGSYKLLIYNEEICSGDNSDYASAPISIGLTVTGSSNTAPVLKFGVSSTDSASVSVNSAYTLKLSDIFTDIDGNTLTYRVYTNGSSTAVPADENYSFTPATAGTTTLRFTAYDGAAESASYTVTLTAGNVLATGITVTGENGATCIGKNGQLQLYVSFQPSNTTNQNVTWTVTMSTQAGEGSVDAGNMLRTSGVVDPSWGNGKATIRATAQDGSGVFGELVLPVLQNIVTGITVSAANTDVAVGDTTQLSATVSPTEAKQDITWSIYSGSDIASISTSGLLTLSGSGTVTVRATAQDGSGLFGEQIFMVKDLQVPPSAPTLMSKTQTTVTLNAITGAEYSMDGYTWQSGTTFTDLSPNTSYSFYARMAGTDTMKFSLSSAALSVTTEKATLGGSVSITGTFKCGQNLNVNTSEITADPSCDLGTISYQWTRDGSNISGATGSIYSLVAADFGKVINVTVAAENCTGIISSSNTTETGKGDQDYTVPTGLKATLGDTLGDVALSEGFTWEAPLTTSVGEIGDNGFTVKYTPDDTNSYNIITNISVTITVGKGDPICTAAPAASAITYGQTLADSTLSGGTFDVEGSFAWTTGTIEPSVSDSDTTEYSVTFTPTDTERYNTITVSVKLTVNKAASFITTAPAASAITNGQMLSDSILSGGSGNIAGNFAWTNGVTKPSLSDSNTTPYSVTFTPIDGNYAPSTTTVTLVVNKATSSVAAPTHGVVNDTANTFTFTAAEGYDEASLYEYSTDGGAKWKDCTTFTINVGNIPVVAGNVQVRLRSTDDYDSGNVLSSTEAFTAELEGTVAITGDARVGGILTAETQGIQNGAVLHYQWKSGSVNIGADKNLYKTAGSEIGKTITVTVTADGYTGKLASSATDAVTKGSAQTSNSGTLNISNRLEQVYEFNLKSLLTNGVDFGNVSYSVVSGDATDYYSDITDSNIFDGMLSISAANVDSSDEKSIGTITVKITSQYYEDMQADINIASINKIAPTTAVTGAFQYVYGEKLSDRSITGSATHDGTPVTGKFVWTSPNYKVKVSDISAKWSFIPDDEEKYVATEGMADIVVSKATLSGTPLFTAIKEASKKLSDVTLTALENWPLGSFAWTDGGDIVVVANTAYAWIFTPNDTDNYNVCTGTVTPYNDSSQTSNGSSSSGHHGGGSSVATVVKTNTSSLPTQATTIVTSTLTNGTVSVAVSQSDVADAIKKAQEEAKKIGNEKNGIAVEIKVDTKDSSASDFSANLPKTSVDELVKEQVKELSINTDSGKMNLDFETLKTIQKQVGADVNVSAKKVNNSTLSPEAKAVVGNRPVFDFAIIGSNGTKVTNFGNGKITVSIPYTLGENEKAENVVAYYIDNEGKVQEMPDCVYDEKTKSVSFVTNHFSIYAVGYKEETSNEINKNTFTDIGNHWAKDAIAYVTENGLFSGTAQGKFSPNGAMTRGMFVTILGRLAKAEASGYTNSSFTDVKANAYYKPYIQWACEKGIAKGVSETTFTPDQSITREQMAVMMASYAKATGFELPQVNKEITFADNGQISSYAKEAVKQMQMVGVLAGKNDNKFDPKGTATRAEVSAVIKRFAELVEEQ